MRVATYNVHGCVGTDRRRSEARIAKVIGELAVDLVALQEVGGGRSHSGQINQASSIAHDLGWHHCFHPATRLSRGDQGHAILSRFPLQLKRAAKLPGRPPPYCPEDRAVIAVEVSTTNGPIVVLGTHFGLGRRERVAQAEYLTSEEWLEGPSARPMILLGDLNCLPGSRAHRRLGLKLRDVRELLRPRRLRPTHPTLFPALAVDHIFVSQEWRAVSLSVHRSPLARVASDHFPLVAELAWGGS